MATPAVEDSGALAASGPSSPPEMAQNDALQQPLTPESDEAAAVPESKNLLDAQSSSNEPHQTRDMSNPAVSAPSDLFEEVRALRGRLSQLEAQAADTPSKHLQSAAEKEKKLRKQIRRARKTKNEVEKVEQRADELADERRHFGGGGCGTSAMRYLKNINGEGGDAHMSGSSDSDVDFAPQERDYWRYLHPVPHQGIRPTASIQPIYSRKLGPPTRWDTSDSEEWSSNASINTRDFTYFRARLRGDFEWELDRLTHQRERYERHKKKKAELEAQKTAQLAEEATRGQSEELQGEGLQKDATGGGKEGDGGKDPEGLGDGTRTDQSKNLYKEFGTPSLNPKDWALFTAARRSTLENSFAIDVLVGEPQIGRGGYWGYSSRAIPTKANANATKVESLSKQDPSGHGSLPERIRINSRQLIKTLSMIRGSELHPEGIDSRTGIVMTRPFRMLTYYDKEIRAWYSKLKADLQPSEAPEAPEAPPPGQVSGATPPTDPERERAPREEGNKVEDPDNHSRSEATLLHLPPLIDFMDKHIAQKKAYLNSSSCDKVSFSDLWHLFAVGDFVMGSDGKQVYRVARIYSPPHKGTDRWAQYAGARSKESNPSFEDMLVYCVYIHFDGTHLGPVMGNFRIKKFDGEKSVTSLDIYPLRFHVLKDLEVRASKNKHETTDFDQLVSLKLAELRRSLVERGKLFVDVTAVKHMYYSGLTVDTRDEIESQVMIDFEEAFAVEKNRHWRPQITRLLGATIVSDEETSARDSKTCEADCCWQETVHDDSVYVEDKRQQEFINSLMAELELEGNTLKLPSAAVFPRTLDDVKTEALKDDDLLIMSYSVFGFVLRDRTWAHLDLTYLTDVVGSGGGDVVEGDMSDDEQDADDDKSAFGRLVLPDGHKDMVLSLVSQHFRNKKNQKGEQDIVRGKGKGLILLLHGAPGVGKTTTAEGVAEKFAKPLFQITCGDLGANAKDVESALQTNFALANRWDCVLLLDEADVFLAERRQNDFSRNGLVAVFLRVLEYYAGILFLTTNRIGDFDEAFASRIHMSLHYPALDEISTIRVFKLNLGMIKARYKESGRKLKIDDTEIIHMVGEFWRKHDKARWNGRQIRNACQTALALAEFDAQPPGKKYDLTQTVNAKVHLKVSHLDKVSKAYLEFMEYLKAVHGADADTHAKESGIRALETAIAALKAGKKVGSTVSTQEGGKAEKPLYSFKLPAKTPPQGQPVSVAPQAAEQPYRERPRTPQSAQYGSPRPPIAAPQPVNSQTSVPQSSAYHQQLPDPSYPQQQYLAPAYPVPYSQPPGHPQAYAQQQAYAPQQNNPYQNSGAAYQGPGPAPFRPSEAELPSGPGGYGPPQPGQGAPQGGSVGQ
ncbi:hypothetical protein OQA88_2383 [Cercophora sp. LCS_1]